MAIPLGIPCIDEHEINAVTEVLRSGWYAHGPKNKEFEELFCRNVGVKHAISMNSCTSALFLALVASGIKGEVIVPSFTFVASANAIVTAGAIPIFADISYDTCNINPDAVAALIGPKTEAIMPVHYAGQVAEMEPILKLAEQHHLLVIEDSAETLGGTYQGRQAGSMGIGCFSFFPTKNITTGEGGMLTTNDDELARKVKALLGHGIESTTLAREKAERPWLRAATMAGYNFRMSNILAALGVEQIKKLEQLNAARRQHAQYLNEHLKDLPFVDLPVESHHGNHVYQMYTIKLKGMDRTRFMARLKDSGIGASVHFDPPVHKQPFYKNKLDWIRQPLPVTEQVAAAIVTLPMFPQLTKQQLDQIISAVKKAGETI